jgi:hypothetical protein
MALFPAAMIAKVEERGPKNRKPISSLHDSLRQQNKP